MSFSLKSCDTLLKSTSDSKVKASKAERKEFNFMIKHLEEDINKTLDISVSTLVIPGRQNAINII